MPRFHHPSITLTHPITKDHVPIVARFRCRPQRGQETLRQMAKEWFWSLAGAFEGQHKSTGLAGSPTQMIHVWIIYLRWVQNGYIQ